MKNKGKTKASVKPRRTKLAAKMETDETASAPSTKEKKRSSPENSGEPLVSRKMPKRAAACSNFKEKSVRLSENSNVIDIKQDHLVEDEVVAIRLTEIAGQEDSRPNRSLVDFILHDDNGVPKQFEMSEVDDLYISALVMPLDESSDKGKGVRCEGFGRIESWAISGYDEGSPVVWISTDLADYDCMKPASSYKRYFDYFFEKARACIEVYKKLSKSCGGNPDLSLDELLAGVVRSMGGGKFFPGGATKDFVISVGDFIYNQLIGLDETSKKNDALFTGLPVLVALRDECKRWGELNKMVPKVSSGCLKIRAEVILGQSSSSSVVNRDEDEKLARLLQEDEYWNSLKKTRRPQSTMKNFYVKINEDEIANDYPLPAYYKTSVEETDEYVVFDHDANCYPEELPRSMLYNWSLYNSDSRLISLELLPMRPCTEVDVTVFGSGTTTVDDGSGFCIDADPMQSSSSSQTANVDGLPIFLSAIKEWMIEFGSSMVFISIRTDMAWYCYVFFSENLIFYFIFFIVILYKMHTLKFFAFFSLNMILEDH